MRKKKSPFAGHRFPVEIISHAVWLYYRFSLSFRDAEELRAARGVVVTYEPIRYWCLKSGRPMAAGIRRRQGRPGDTWRLDEVFVSINGVRHYLWRAVDQDGDALEILVRKKRNGNATKRFFRKLLKGLRGFYSVFRAEADCHRQTPQLFRGSRGAVARRRAYSGQGLKPPGGELSPSHKATGKADATIQVRRPFATVPFGTWPDQQRFPGRPPSHESKALPHHARASLLPMG